MTETGDRLLNPEQKQKINGSVCRVIKSKDYTTISNIHLRDKSLSLKAKGLLSMVLSLPEDWNYSIAGLVSLVQEGEFAVRNTLKELKEHKYLVVRKIMPNTETKILTYEYVFFESPRLYSQDATNQGAGSQPLENPPQLNIDKPTTNKPNTEILSTNVDKQYIVEKPKKQGKQVFTKPTIEQLKAYNQEKGFHIDCEEFFDYYEAKGWRLKGGDKMADWQATMRRWERFRKENIQKGDKANGVTPGKYARVGRVIEV